MGSGGLLAFWHCGLWVGFGCGMAAQVVVGCSKVQDKKTMSLERLFLEDVQAEVFPESSHAKGLGGM